MIITYSNESSPKIAFKNNELFRYKRSCKYLNHTNDTCRMILKTKYSSFQTKLEKKIKTTFTSSEALENYKKQLSPDIH